MEADIRYFAQVGSTNTVLKSLADEGAKEGTCVVATEQTEGEGRSGRSFFSPSGNLYMSLLLRPKDERLFGIITVIAAVAAVEAIKQRFGVSCDIKWVNDIIHDGRKAGGIIAKAFGIGTENAYVILGIGINIFEASGIPDDIKDVYGSILGKDDAQSLGKDDLIALSRTVIERFSRYYDKALIKEAVDEYRRYSFVTGKRVEYISGNDIFSAMCAGISDDGGLILETSDGRRCFHDGEIRIRMIPCLDK